jgi:hypothetical protein
MPKSALYRYSVYQSSFVLCDEGSDRLKARLTADGIPWEVEESTWRDCERMVPCPERPEGWELELDAVKQLTIYVPDEFLERAQTILTALGLKSWT